MNETIIMGSVLRVVAEASQTWTAAEVADLLDGRATLQIIPKIVDSKRKVSLRASSLSEEAILATIGELRRATSREQVVTKLEDAQFTRRELEQLSRQLDLPVAKHDTVEALKHNIAEELVGSSLNSKAIRGDVV